MTTEKTSMDRKIIIGLIFISLGFLYFLNLFNIFSFNLNYYIFSWKTILIIIGLIILGNPNNRATGLILIGTGIFFWIPEFFNFRVRFSHIFFPSLLIVIGILLITKRKSPLNSCNKHHFSKYTDQKSGEEHSKSNAQTEDEFTAYEEVTDEKKSNSNHNAHQSFYDKNVFSRDFIDETVVFSGKTIKLVSERFLGGKLTAVFGGMDINMYNVKLASGGIVVDNTAIFGGITLIVPDDWTVKSEVISIFGGYDDNRIIKGGFSSNPEKTLILKGLVLFGGIDLKNF